MANVSNGARTMMKTVAGRSVGEHLEPLAVSPKQACLLLGVGNTRLYQLISNGELVAYKDGRARRVTMASIHARVARLAASAGARETQAAPPRPRGRPRKSANAVAP
jgi:excisionase family DNA binding protein